MDNFIYIVSKKSNNLRLDLEYLICDKECSSESERTIDIEFNKLARNSKLLDKLKLESMYANKPNGVAWFASYLSAFGNGTLAYNKLLTNPTLRIIIGNEKLLNEIQTIGLYK